MTNRPKLRGVVVLPDGRYRARKWHTDPKTGRRRKREKTFVTLAQAVTWREQKGGDEPQKQERHRFSSFSMQWMRDNGTRYRPHARRYYAGGLHHLCRAFGDIYLDMIEPSDIRAMQSNGRSAGYSAVTLNGWLRIARQVLEVAVMDGLVASNPARLVKALPEPPTSGPRGTAYDRDEFLAFVGKVVELTGTPDGIPSSDVARMILACAWSGCRKGELAALTWDDVRGSELHITKSVSHRQVFPTKTADPRIATVLPPLADVLSEQRRWLMREQHPALPTGLVFPASPRHAKGGASRRRGEICWHRSATTMSKWIKLAAAKAGIRPISEHGLRRTYETLGKRAGIEDIVRRSISGWRDQGTQSLYSAVGREDREQAAAKLMTYLQADQ